MEEREIVYDADGEFVYADEKDDENYRDGWDSVATDDDPARTAEALDPEIVAEVEENYANDENEDYLV